MEHLVKQVSRRKFTLMAGATAMVELGLKGCSSSNAESQLTAIKAANVNAGGGNETTKARIGFIWHVRLINQKLGHTAFISNEFWQDHPEKALAFRSDWVDRHPNTTKSIVKGSIEAQ